jgi:hypothetical protein
MAWSGLPVGFCCESDSDCERRRNVTFTAIHGAFLPDRGHGGGQSDLRIAGMDALRFTSTEPSQGLFSLIMISATTICAR